MQSTGNIEAIDRGAANDSAVEHRYTLGRTTRGRMLRRRQTKTVYPISFVEVIHAV